MTHEISGKKISGNKILKLEKKDDVNVNNKEERVFGVTLPGFIELGKKDTNECIQKGLYSEEENVN